MVMERDMQEWSRKAWLASSALACTIAAPTLAQSRQFDVPAQAAETAISMFGHQAGVQIVAARTYTHGKRTKAVRGTMPVESALSQMLEGTGLQAQKSGPQTYVIVGPQGGGDRNGRTNTNAAPSPSGLTTTATEGSQAGVASEITTNGIPEGGTTSEAAGSVSGAATDNAIVVTGVRASLQSAQNIKRNSSQIVDSIVAEDIGKLPDRNVAEALQRIPGIQIQRNFGEGSAAAIRGLTQVRTELNGRDIFTASNASSLTLEDVPSELLAGIDVYKNPSADMIEDQLAGSINFRTRKPFDFNGFKFSASASQSYFDLAGQSRPSGSMLLSDRWNTGIGEIGVLVDLSYQKTTFREDTINVEPAYTLDTSLNAAGQPNNPIDYGDAQKLGRLGQTTTLQHGGGVGQHFGDRRRFGTDVAIQWRPSDTLELTGELFRNDYKFRFDDYSWLANTGGASIDVLGGAPFTFASNGDMTSGTFQNVPVNSNTSLATRHSITTDYSLNAKWKPTPNLTITADGQYVHATSDALRSIVILTSTAPTFSQDLRGSLPAMQVGPAGYAANPGNYSDGALLDDLNRTVGNDKSFRLDAEYRFDSGFLRSIKTGFRYSNRTNDYDDTGYRYTGVAPGLPNYERVDLSDFYRGDANLFGDVIAFPRSIIKNYDATLAALGISSRPTYYPSGAYAIADKDYAGYVAAFFKADNLPVPIDGNVGVRIVHTDVSAAGFYQLVPQVNQPDGTQTSGAPVFQPIGQSQSYTKFLPSLNVRAHLTSKLQLRLAASANLARPSFNQLSPNLSLNEPGTATQNEIHSSSGGNPALKPMTSRNFDASLEWYFARTGSLSVAGFYKRINNYIQTAVVTSDITFPDGQSYPYDITSYNNAAKATVKGAEAAYQQFFDFLPGPLRGLGLQANFTYVSSKAPSPATSGPVVNVPLEGLSKYSYNLVGMYELGKVSARIAYNWRSKYLETTAGNGTGNLPIFMKPLGYLDASVTYDVTPHFSLTVDGRNLANTQMYDYFGLRTRPQNITIDDRRITGTARITF
jgi:TonB-dependent receptor